MTGPRLKGRLPWRLGATSFVIPADLADNVRLLAPLVDDVQLLFFESAGRQGLDRVVDCRELRCLAHRHDLTYTVHLPTDIRLGADDTDLRRQGILEIQRLLASLAELEPLSFDLHLVREALPESRWLANLDQALAELAGCLGPDTRRLAIENLDYPVAVIMPLFARYGFSLCLDLGHVRHYGHDWLQALELVTSARHLHLHGLSQGRDHRALTAATDRSSQELGQRLAAVDFRGVVTLEVYDWQQLSASLAYLETAWLDFSG